MKFEAHFDHPQSLSILQRNRFKNTKEKMENHIFTNYVKSHLRKKFNSPKYQFCYQRRFFWYPLWVCLLKICCVPNVIICQKMAQKGNFGAYFDISHWTYFQQTYTRWVSKELSQIAEMIFRAINTFSVTDFICNL